MMKLGCFGVMIVVLWGCADLSHNGHRILHAQLCSGAHTLANMATRGYTKVSLSGTAKLIQVTDDWGSVEEVVCPPSAVEGGSALIVPSGRRLTLSDGKSSAPLEIHVAGFLTIDDCRVQQAWKILALKGSDVHISSSRVLCSDGDGLEALDADRVTVTRSTFTGESKCLFSGKASSWDILDCDLHVEMLDLSLLDISGNDVRVDSSRISLVDSSRTELSRVDRAVCLLSAEKTVFFTHNRAEGKQGDRLLGSWVRAVEVWGERVVFDGNLVRHLNAHTVVRLCGGSVEASSNSFTDCTTRNYCMIANVRGLATIVDCEFTRIHCDRGVIVTVMAENARVAGCSVTSATGDHDSWVWDFGESHNTLWRDNTTAFCDIGGLLYFVWGGNGIAPFRDQLSSRWVFGNRIQRTVAGSDWGSSLDDCDIFSFNERKEPKAYKSLIESRHGDTKSTRSWLDSCERSGVVPLIPTEEAR